MAIVNDEMGVIFLCTAKVASTSIESALTSMSRSERLPGGKHMGARALNNKVFPLLKRKYPQAEFTSFCMVREPLQRLNSWWRYRQRLEAEDKNCTAGMSFVEFIEKHLEYLKGNKSSTKSNVQVRPQSKWVIDKKNKYVIDKTFALDNFNEVESFLQPKTEQTIQIPRKNVSPEQDKSSVSIIQGKLLEDLKKALELDYKIYDLALASADSPKQYFQTLWS